MFSGVNGQRHTNSSPFTIAGIALEEKRDIRPSSLPLRRLRDRRFQAARGVAKTDHAVALVECVAEPVAGESIAQCEQSVGVGTCPPTRHEVDPERWHIAIRAVSFHDQKPVERALRMPSRPLPDSPQPCRRQCLMPPVQAFHDGIAREQDSDIAAVMRKREPLQGRETAKCASVPDRDDFVLGAKVVVEAGAICPVVVHREQPIHGLAQIRIELGYRDDPGLKTKVRRHLSAPTSHHCFRAELSAQSVVTSSRGCQVPPMSDSRPLC